MIEAIFFDVGGVLVWDLLDTKLQDLARKYGLALEQLLRLKKPLRIRADLGEITEEEYWRSLLDEAGVVATQEDLDIRSYLRLVAGTLDVARRLAGRYRVAILSNDTCELARARRLAFGFDALFDPIIISAEIGLKKPDPQIFDHAVQRIGTTADRCLFIDNRQDNVRGAADRGWQTILFTSAEQLSEELERLGILPRGL